MPACISPREVPNEEVATLAPVSRLNSDVLPLLGRPINPIFTACHATIRPGLTTPRPLDVKGTAVALVLHAVWSANPVAVKIGLADCPPLRLAWLRFVLGGLAVLLWAWMTGQRGIFRVRPGEGRILLNAGLLFAVQIGLMNVGIAHTSPTHATVFFNSYAVHAVVLAHFQIPGDRMTASKLTGILVAYAGIVLLFGRAFSLSAETLAGDIIVSVSAALLGERMVYTARAVQKVEPTTFLIYQSAIGSACFILVSLFWEAGQPTRYTTSLLLSLFFQGVVVAGFNFVVNLELLRIYRPSALAACALSTPIFGVLISAAIYGDELTPLLLVSSIMVAAGIGLTTRR
jgi:drug/metabolite transporter (DMT)-like permease